MRSRPLVIAGLVLPALVGTPAQTSQPGSALRQPAAQDQRPAPKPQPRPAGTRIVVDRSRISTDDGDTIAIRWSPGDVEQVRILGIDTPETRHVEHRIPEDQSYGPEARGFLRGVLAASQKVEVARAATLDPYGRTLGYLFVDRLNYSLLVIRARLAYESVTAFGDNGFPREAAEVLAAAKAAGPLPFEPPYLFRQRMGALTDWLSRTPD